MKIEVCNVCNGGGQLIDRDAYRRDEVWYECDNCKGSGRVLKLSYEFEVPFGTDINKINDVSTEIVKSINALKEYLKKHNV